MISKSEIEFGKLGYLRHEDDNMIVYYIPYKRNDIRYDDITFCKNTKKIIFYQGSSLGSDAYRMDYRVINAIQIQCLELGWEF